MFNSKKLLMAQDSHGDIILTSPDTAVVIVEKTITAQVWLIGSGAERSHYYQYISPQWGAVDFWSGGGSGAGFIGKIRLDPDTYTFTLGRTSYNAKSGTSEFDVRTFSTTLVGQNYGLLIKAGSGADTNNPQGTMASVSDGGQLIIQQNAQIIQGSVTLQTNGNNCVSSTGGASVWNGYGKGSDDNANNATTGYVRVKW